MATSVRIPRYILNASTGPLRPELIQPPLNVPTKAIYAFTNKSSYDAFHKNYGSEPELLPYPLIKGYMQGQVDADLDVCQLVAIDCASPTQSPLSAVTMLAIISALELKSESIEISHTLTLDADSPLYHVQVGVPSSMHDSHESSVR